MVHAEARILVIGGGPAGSCCAIRLRQHGIAVDLAEKHSFPRPKVCGCCLGGAGLAALDVLGLAEPILRLGCPISRWQGSIGSRSVTIALPSGVSISRELLDAELLRAASSAGATVGQPTRAVIVDSDPSGVTVRIDRNGSQCQRVYDCVVVAAGLNAAGVSRFLPWVQAPSGPFGVGFTADLGNDCEPGVIYMACDDDGYVGVVRLEDGRADVAAALRSGTAARVGAAPIDRVRQILASSRLPRWSFSDDTAVMTTPALRRRRVVGRNRVLAIGDTAGYVEPFTGEGITWAIQSGILAAETIANHPSDWLTIGEEWRQIYASAFSSRNFLCRAVTTAMRSSLARRVIGPTLAMWPGLARPLVRRLNSGSV
jgi:flavin-dependent dehydrogenase